MEKNCFYGIGIPIYFKKLLFITRLCLFLVFVLHFSVIASGYAQQKVSLSMQNVTLEQVLKELKQQTGLRFFYSVEKVRREQKDVINIKDELLQDALREILKGTGLTFTFMKDVVVIKDEVSSSVRNAEKDQKSIKGKVIDKAGLPLPGVTVLIKGTKVGVSTNVDGIFEITVRDTSNLMLSFSFIGMKTKVLPCEDRPKKGTWIIVLEEDIKQMDEIIVNGYENLKKGNIAGAISTISKDDLEMIGITIEQMLQAKLPGLSIQTQSGMTGTRQKVRVRGTSTLLGNQDPIWVIDGIIQEDPLPFEKNEFDNIGSIDRGDFDLLKDFVGTSIGWLSPYDIETISVLKDASATAIYGTKAANGVIVITTKKGAKGQMSVNYNGGIAVTPRLTYNKLELMNSKERIDMSREAFVNGVLYGGVGDLENIGYEGVLKRYLAREISYNEYNDQVKKLESRNTDWFDILFRNAVSTNHNLGISGGSDKISFRASMGVNKTNNTAKGNDATTYNGSLFAQANLRENLRISLKLAGSMRETNAFYKVSPYDYATSVSRAIPCFDENGKEYFYQHANGYKYNVLYELSQTGNKNKENSLNWNFNLNWNICKGLEYETLLGIGLTNSHAESYASELTNYITKEREYEFGLLSAEDEGYKRSNLPHGGQLNTSENRNFNYTWRNMIRYKKTFEDGHDFNISIGLEIRENKYDGLEMTVFGYFPDRGKAIDLPARQVKNYMDQMQANPIYDKFVNRMIDRKSNYLSYFAMGTYSYQGRYSLNANVRTDASNRFGENKAHRFLPVWSIGGRWNLQEENWLKDQNVIDLLSIRATYGFQGNVLENHGPDLIVKMLPPNENTGEYEVAISRLPFKDLTWEKSKSVNLGLDVTLWKNLINLTADYYYKKTTDAIINKAIPYEYGTSSLPINSGQILNKGIELAFTANLIRTKNFAWNLSFNYAKNTNEVKRADVQNQTWENAVTGNLIVKGYPLSGFWAFDYEKLNDKGLPIFSFEENPVQSDLILDYMKYMGKLAPDFTGGFSTRFKYNAFSVGASFNLQIGGKKFLAPLIKNTGGMISGYENSTNEYVHRWRHPGDENLTDIPGIRSIGDALYNSTNQMIAARMEAYNNSDIRVVNASFLKCSSIQIGYVFPTSILEKWHLKGLSLSGIVSQPFQIVSKGFRGRDPEVATGAQPQVSSYTLNVNVSF